MKKELSKKEKLELENIAINILRNDYGVTSNFEKLYTIDYSEEIKKINIDKRLIKKNMINYREKYFIVLKHPDGSVLKIPKKLCISLEKFEFYLHNELEKMQSNNEPRDVIIQYLENKKYDVNINYTYSEAREKLLSNIDFFINQYSGNELQNKREIRTDLKFFKYDGRKKKYKFITDSETQIQLAFEIFRYFNFPENKKEIDWTLLKNKIYFDKIKLKNIKDYFGTYDLNRKKNNVLFNELEYILKF